MGYNQSLTERGHYHKSELMCPLVPSGTGLFLSSPLKSSLLLQPSCRLLPNQSLKSTHNHPWDHPTPSKALDRVEALFPCNSFHQISSQQRALPLLTSPFKKQMFWNDSEILDLVSHPYISIKSSILLTFH